MTTRFGLQLWSQATDWPGFRDAALAAEEAGWDSVWTWDHLMAIFGPWEQPILEGWTTLAALGPITKRVRLGLMVGANTFRNPGLTAKLATTLDHVSGGRAVLGIGGAWFEREHEAFGIEFGKSPGERLDWLDESVMLIRRLLDGERVDHDGPRYPMRDALCEPRPIQPHLPILIGGSGRRKTLRTVAQRADAWNANGSVDELRDALETLERHCCRRRPRHRHDRTDSELPHHPARRRRCGAGSDGGAAGPQRRVDMDGFGQSVAGSPAEVADILRPYRDLGFSTFIVRMPAPYDRETIERMPEVGALLDG